MKKTVEIILLWILILLSIGVWINCNYKKPMWHHIAIIHEGRTVTFFYKVNKTNSKVYIDGIKVR